MKRAEPMKMGSIFYINQPGGLHQIEWIRHLWGNDLALTKNPFSSHLMNTNANLGSRLSSVSEHTRLTRVYSFNATDRDEPHTHTHSNTVTNKTCRHTSLHFYVSGNISAHFWEHIAHITAPYPNHNQPDSHPTLT